MTLKLGGACTVELSSDGALFNEVAKVVTVNVADNHQRNQEVLHCGDEQQVGNRFKFTFTIESMDVDPNAAWRADVVTMNATAEAAGTIENNQLRITTGGGSVFLFKRLKNVLVHEVLTEFNQNLRVRIVADAEAKELSSILVFTT